jgi:hypothetical protein
MIAPTGEVGDVPEDRVPDAAKAGFSVGQDMLSPDGKIGVVPVDRVHEAIAKGFQLKGAPVKPPIEAMQKSNVGIALGSDGTERSAIANPQQPAEQFALENPDQQGKLVAAAAIGAGGAAISAGVPALLPAATKGVVAIGNWAEAHPILARLVYEGIKGAAWYKLIKKASDIGNAGRE